MLKKFLHIYFASKQVARGSGFGLNLCGQITLEYHGNIKAESEEGEGITITIIL